MAAFPVLVLFVNLMNVQGHSSYVRVQEAAREKQNVSALTIQQAGIIPGGYDGAYVTGRHPEAVAHRATELAMSLLNIEGRSSYTRLGKRPENQNDPAATISQAGIIARASIGGGATMSRSERIHHAASKRSRPSKAVAQQAAELAAAVSLFHVEDRSSYVQPEEGRTKTNDTAPNVWQAGDIAPYPSHVASFGNTSSDDAASSRSQRQEAVAQQAAEVAAQLASAQRVQQDLEDQTSHDKSVVGDTKAPTQAMVPRGDPRNTAIARSVERVGGGNDPPFHSTDLPEVDKVIDLGHGKTLEIREKLKLVDASPEKVAELLAKEKKSRIGKDDEPADESAENLTSY